MLPSSCSDATILVERQPAPGQRIERIGPGLICSLVLHGLAALLIILLLPSVLREPEVEQVIFVDLVGLGAGTAALPRQETGEPMQEAAREAPRPAHADPEPAAPTVEPAPSEPEHVRQPDKPAVVTPRHKPEPSNSREGPRLDPRVAVKPTDRATPPADDLDARLKSLARQQQLQAQAPANRNPRNDAGSSSLAAAGNGVAGGGGARYNVKDFIRAQIERHWRLDSGARGADFVVAIHLTLNRDGSVKSADIVDDPRYRASAVYQALARSARNAVLLSSPLDLPPGRYDEVAEMTLNFNPRNALQ